MTEASAGTTHAQRRITHFLPKDFLQPRELILLGKEV